MTFYSVALFAHVAGAVLFFAALALDGVALRGLRRAAAISQVADWAGVVRLTRVIGPASAVAILVPGLYMMAAAWGWAAWIMAGTAGWLLAAVLGTVAGIRLAGAVRDAAGQGPIPAALSARLRHPLLVSCWLARAATAAGIVFVMTVKPPPTAAAAAIAVPAAAGLAASLPAWRRAAARTDAGPAGSGGHRGSGAAAEATVNASDGARSMSSTSNH